MDGRKAWLRLGAYILLLAGLAVTRHVVFPELGPDDARQVIEDVGPWPPTVLMFLFLVAGALYLPMSWLMVVSGAAFGLPRGLAWSYAGIVGASLLGFMLARQTRLDLRRWLRKRLPDFLQELPKQPWALTAVRAVPVVPEGLFNGACGLRRIPFRAFAQAILIGTVPAVMAYTMLGTVIGGLRLDDPARWPWSLGAAMLALSAFVGLGAWAMHRHKQ